MTTATLQHSITPSSSSAPALPVLAIVGRPNVGKSTLFNRIVGRRVAIVHEQAGVTRDRVQARAQWQDKTFEVVDTGGIGFLDEEKSADELVSATRRQAEVAIAMAAVIIMVADVTDGVVPLDLAIARKLRASGKPVLLAVNKVDNRGREPGVAEFAELGFDRVFPVAAAHGLGMPELLDAATSSFVVGGMAETARPTRIAIVGRPNVGKSSLLNAILGSERTIVSEIPGTTRDSVDAPFIWREHDRERPYVLIDTAGLRHKRKIKSSVDQFGLMRAEGTIQHCDLAVLVLDAAAGVTKQDQHIAGEILAAGRACVIAVNKWDLAAEEERRPEGRGGRAEGGWRKKPKSFREEYLAALRRELFFLDWAPVVFLSAKTGERVLELFSVIGAIEEQMTRRVETPLLNRALAQALDSYPPPFLHGKRLKIFYAFQKSVAPPQFTLFVNDARCLTPHYARFLTDKLRAAWGFAGCPVLLTCQQRQHREFHKK